MDEEKKQIKVSSQSPKLLTSEDKEMIENDSYEAQFISDYDDHDRD